jgi:nucleotide-binding universal stress UspA family protein
MGKIVVGVDGSPSSSTAASWACDEARRRGVEVTAVHAWSYPYQGRRTGITEPRDLMELDAAQLLDDVTHQLKHEHHDVTVHPRLVDGSITGALLTEAADADLLVVGSRGHGGFASALFGSVSQAMWHHAPCPIVVVRAGVLPEPRGRILVEVDGSAGSIDAVRWAVNEARRRGATVLAVATWDYPVVAFGGLDVPVFPFIEQAADALAHVRGVVEAAEAGDTAVIIESEVAEGKPERVLILRSAEADLVVLPARRAMGAVGSRVVAHSHCPTVIVPQHDD